MLIVQSPQTNGQLQEKLLWKFHHFFGGSTSWFKCEELIGDWLDLTVLEAGKRGPAQKNKLVGDAAMYKGLLGRESLRAEERVKYFKDTLRLRFIQGAQSVFLWRFSQFIRARRENMEVVKWIGKFSVLLERLRDAWMEMLPMSAMSGTPSQQGHPMAKKITSVCD